jgi:hypothetical protein
MELRQSQMPKELKSVKDSFISVVVHRVSNLIHLTHVPNKQPATITPKLLDAIEWICEKTGQPVKGTLLVTDSGFEYETPTLRKKGIIHLTKKLAESAEASVGRTRRTFFKVLAKKVGGVRASLQQTQDILNNAASKVHKNKSPLEVAQQNADESISQFNSKRQKANLSDRPKLAVGTTVRRVNRHYKKSKMYKSNSGVQWHPKKYTILGVSTKRPFRYKLLVTEKVRNKIVTHNKWHNRDELQVIPKKDDAVSKKMLENRLQSGTQIKVYVKPNAKKASPVKRRRSTRSGAQQGIAKRRKTRNIMDALRL